ncbi:DUF1275 domain-containing protein [bacterium]|nr:DUF1275 domain-containing protein [bacterium]
MSHVEREFSAGTDIPVEKTTKNIKFQLLINYIRRQKVSIIIPGRTFLVRRQKITDAVPFRAQLAWYNLAFTAGMINSGGFLACRRFVSHVTGFVTLSGVDFVQHSWREGLSALFHPRCHDQRLVHRTAPRRLSSTQPHPGSCHRRRHHGRHDRPRTPRIPRPLRRH